MRTTPSTPGGMFDEFEPAPAAPATETAPLFPAAGAPVAAARDYGVPVAPTREPVTGALFETELVVGDDGALVFGLVDLDSPAAHGLDVVDIGPAELAALTGLPLID